MQYSLGPAMNVLIADDHPIVRQGLKQILAAERDMVVVGEAKTGDEALQLARDLDWDVAILDYSMPGATGLEVLKQIKQSYPARPVLILSIHPEDSIAVSVLRAGAAGYVSKECASEELMVAIRKAVSGTKYVSATLAERLAFELEEGSDARPHELLSDREYRVMWMLASGKSIRHIAEELLLSPNTVSTYRVRILKKLKLENNAELVRYAVKHGLME
jgi:two-component system, NarL family, invasion response regulator UvrY